MKHLDREIERENERERERERERVRRNMFNYEQDILDKIHHNESNAFLGKETRHV